MRHLLRTRLEPLHSRLDRMVEAACFQEPLDLGRLLRIHHEALTAIVPALEQAGAANLFPGWEGRSRLALLEADLADLDTRPAAAGNPPALPDERDVWGALYAIEGSRLGNRVLLRRVTERGNGRERQATRFLAQAPAAQASWAAFVVQLDALDYRGKDFETALRGAEAVFGVYLAAAAAR